MEPESHLSFGRLVVGKALSGTKRAFESLLRDVVIGVLSAAFGFGAYWRIFGLPEAMSETLSFILFGFGPLGLIVTAVFFWNLWLAPAELAYQASQRAINMPSPRTRGEHRPTDIVNWSPWKKMSRFTVSQFASILARETPNSRHSFDASAFEQLIVTEILSKKLRYIEELSRGSTGVGPQYPVPFSTSSKIDRQVALLWAKEKELDVSHIE